MLIFILSLFACIQPDDQLYPYGAEFGLYDCETGWVRLPASSDDPNRSGDQWSWSVLHDAMNEYNPEYYPALVGIVYDTTGELYAWGNEIQLGWKINPDEGEYSVNGAFINYVDVGPWTEETAPYTLACAWSYIP